MIQAGVIDHLQNRMHGTCFWIVGPVHQTADAGMYGRTRAHGARLNCSKQFAAAEAMIAEVASSIAEGDDFGVRGRVAVGDVAIPSPANDAAGVHNDRADGDFTSL